MILDLRFTITLVKRSPGFDYVVVNSFLYYISNVKREISLAYNNHIMIVVT